MEIQGALKPQATRVVKPDLASGGHSRAKGGSANPMVELQDSLAQNIGLIRVLFKDTAQINMCPPIDDVAQRIIDVWGIRDPAKTKALYELLVLCQPAAEHQVADFNVFSDMLRKHKTRRAVEIQQDVLRRQQEVIRKNPILQSPGGGSTEMLVVQPGSCRASSARPKIRTRTDDRSHQQHSQRAAKPSSNPAAYDHDDEPATNQPPPLAASTIGPWSKWLSTFSACRSVKDPTLSWHRFQKAVDSLPSTWQSGRPFSASCSNSHQTAQPVPMHCDHWAARQFFASVAGSVTGHASASSLATYFLTSNIPRKPCVSSNSAGALGALQWSNQQQQNHQTLLPMSNSPRSVVGMQAIETASIPAVFPARPGTSSTRASPRRAKEGPPPLDSARMRTKAVALRDESNQRLIQSNTQCSALPPMSATSAKRVPHRPHLPPGSTATSALTSSI